MGRNRCDGPTPLYVTSHRLHRLDTRQALVVDIRVDEKVKHSMNEIQAASRLRVAAAEKAEAEKIIQVRPTALPHCAHSACQFNAGASPLLLIPD